MHHLFGPGQATEVAVNDDAVEAVVYKDQQAGEQLCETFPRSSVLRSCLDNSIISPAAGGIKICGVEVWRGGLDGAYLLADPFVRRCLTNPVLLRFHTPLIEPDRRVSRIRLSEKGSRGRPRKVAGSLSKLN
jgi:hypothetical protein